MNDKQNNMTDEEFDSLFENYRKTFQSVQPSSERLQKRIDLAVETHRKLYGKEKKTIIYTFAEYYSKFRFSPAFKPALSIACAIIIFVGIYYIGFKDYYKPANQIRISNRQIVSKGEDSSQKIISSIKSIETVQKITLHQKSFGIAKTKIQDSVIISDYAESFKKLSALNLEMDSLNHKQYISDWIRLSGDSLYGDKQSRIVFLLDTNYIRVCFEKQTLGKDSNTLRIIDKNKIIKYFNKLKNK